MVQPDNETSLAEIEQILEDNRDFIIRYLEPDDLIDELIQARLVGPNAAQRMQLPDRSRTDKNRIIFEQLNTAGPDSLNVFCEILRRNKRQDFIAERLDKRKSDAGPLYSSS